MVYTQETLQKEIQKKAEEVREWFEEVYPAIGFETNTFFAKENLSTRVEFYLYPPNGVASKMFYTEITEKIRIDDPGDWMFRILADFVPKTKKKLEEIASTPWE